MASAKRRWFRNGQKWRTGREGSPRLVAADAAFYSAKNEVAAKAKGIKRFCVPNRPMVPLVRQVMKRARGLKSSPLAASAIGSYSIQRDRLSIFAPESS
jgi:hypothetical protein